MEDAGTVLTALITYIGNIANAVYQNKIIFIAVAIMLAGHAVNFFLRLLKSI